MDGAGAPESCSEDFITFNGVDIPIDDLFGKGVTMKTPADEQFEQLEAGGDLEEFEEDFTEFQEDDETAERAIGLMQPQRESVATILGKRPPEIEVLTEDKEFENVTDDGLVKKKVIKAGTGKKVTPDARVFFHYVVFCNDSLEPYDSTLGRRPCCVNLEPPGEVILGLRLVLKTMQVAEIAQILIHHKYGYLTVGCPPRIPGKATLVYNLQMVTFMPVEKLTVSQLSYEERSNLPFSDIFDAAKTFRRNGNWEMKTKNWRPAIRCYRRATDLLDEYSTYNQKDNDDRCEFLSSLYANIGKAYLKLNSPEPCCVACKRGLELQVGSSMGSLLRVFAQAKIMLYSYTHALDLVKKARKYGNENACERLETEIRHKMAEEKKREAMLAKKMLGLSTKEKPTKAATGSNDIDAVPE